MVIAMADRSYQDCVLVIVANWHTLCDVQHCGAEVAPEVRREIDAFDAEFQRALARHHGVGEPCRVCKGDGVVPDAHGTMRPCSRCRPADFNQFCTDRAAKLHSDLPATPSNGGIDG